MKIQMLPSTIDENRMASARQHLPTLIIDDRVAIDAGCLAFSCSDRQREQVRDVVLTHTHLDHIAGLPLFIDDLFASLTGPIRVHVTGEMRSILERDIFNWSIYPRFSELRNANGQVVEYCEYVAGDTVNIGSLSLKSVQVNHKVAANGFIISDGFSTIALTGDTAETDEFWRLCAGTEGLKAILAECAFPNELEELARVSYHLTPKRLMSEVDKLNDPTTPIFVINIKPMYRQQVIAELAGRDQIRILNIGDVYEF